jgi:hypothetical protein
MGTALLSIICPRGTVPGIAAAKEVHIGISSILGDLMGTATSTHAPTTGIGL